MWLICGFICSANKKFNICAIYKQPANRKEMTYEVQFIHASQLQKHPPDTICFFGNY